MASDPRAELIERLVTGKIKHGDPLVDHVVAQVRRINAESAELAGAINEIDRRRPGMIGRLQQYHDEHARQLQELAACLEKLEKKPAKRKR